MMKWYHYVMCFFGGVFTANFVPHYVNGVSGRMFPSPFNFLVGQPPPPVGLSPPTLNVAWALANLAVGYVLLRYGKFSFKNWPTVIVAAVAVALMSEMLATTFAAAPK
jgi:hypothetical protein